MGTKTLNLPTIGLLLLFLAAVFAGCGGEESAAEPLPLRTPRPTFTPTPLAPAATTAPEPPTAVPAAPAPPAPSGPQVPAVVNSDLVNVRTGPGTDQPIVATITNGQAIDLIGQNQEGDWWQVCCVDGQTGWVFYAYMTAQGATDALPVVGEAPQPAPTTPPPPTAAPPAAAAAPAAPVEVAQPQPPTATPAPTATAAPAFAFNLAAQEQFPEGNDLVRIYLYVYQGDQAFEGYSLHVSKDGVEVPVSAKSAANAGFTWPVANPRQRFQNMKVEFPNMQPGGVWEIQLIDGSGAKVGPPAVFNLEPGDPDRELYLRYEKP